MAISNDTICFIQIILHIDVHFKDYQSTYALNDLWLLKHDFNVRCKSFCKNMLKVNMW